MLFDVYAEGIEKTEMQNLILRNFISAIFCSKWTAGYATKAMAYVNRWLTAHEIFEPSKRIKACTSKCDTFNKIWVRHMGIDFFDKKIDSLFG